MATRPAGPPAIDRVRRPGPLLWREGALCALPAILVVIVLTLFDALSLGMLVLALVAGAVASVAVGLYRVEEQEQLGRWLARLARGDQAKRPEGLSDFTAERLIKPVQALLRQLRREQRTAEAQRRFAEQLIDALPDPIMVIDGELTITRCNPSLQRNFLIDDMPLPVGRVLRDPGVLGAIEAALEGNKTTSVPFRPVSNQRKQFAARIEPVEFAEGGRGALVSMREETEQLMIERIRSDFVANASHEMKTPLTAIQGLIETLQGPARDDEQARHGFLSIMAEETARMTRLVDDLLSLSRIELLADDPPQELTRLEPILTRVIEQMRPFADRAGVRLRRLGEEVLPPVVGDRDQIQQLFVNLIDNAIKYGAGGDRIDIETASVDEAAGNAGPLSGRPAVVVHVIDYGAGIPPEHISRLTERFYRVDKGRSRRIGGTGLGLAIVKHIIRRHRAHLVIESELGRGSRFTVLLPAAASSRSIAA